MLRVGPTLSTLPADLVDRTSRIEPATVGHVIHRGFALGLRPVTTANRFVGTAMTVRLSSMDGTALHYAADEVQPGHVVVIDMGGPRPSHRRCHGRVYVVGAACGRRGHPWYGNRHGRPGSIRGARVRKGAEANQHTPSRQRRGYHLPVSIAGTIVRPGDLVIADPNLVVFLDPAEFSALYDNLVHLQDEERPALEEIRAGVKLSDKFGIDEMVRRNAAYIHA